MQNFEMNVQKHSYLTKVLKLTINKKVDKILHDSLSHKYNFSLPLIWPGKYVPILYVSLKYNLKISMTI